MLNRDIINQTSRRLRDVSQKEWQLSILVAAYNSAIQTLMNVRPTSNTICRDLELKEGHEQEIDSDMHKLIHVLHNSCPDGTAKRAVTLVEMGIMDSTLQHWRQDPSRGYIEHYMMTETNDRKFHVWPPAIEGQKLRVEASIIPEVSEDELDNEMPLNLQYAPALMEWMLYYCYSVDDEMTPNNGRGRNHFENFFNLMQTKVQNTFRIREIRDEVD